MDKNFLNISLERDELGRNIGGYIPRGAIALVEGDPGSGKSILSQRLAFGMVKNGHSVSYISTELNLMGFIKQMNSLGYGISSDIINEKLVFISLLPQIGDSGIKKNIIFDLLTSKHIFEQECVIVDLVSDFMVEDNLTKEDCFKLTKLLKQISSTGKTLILCADPNQVSAKFLEILRGQSDLYFLNESKMVLGNLLNIINIKRFKMPAGEVTRGIPFKVIPGSGLSVEIASLS